MLLTVLSGKKNIAFTSDAIHGSYVILNINETQFM